MANSSFDERTVEMMERNSERLSSINTMEGANKKALKGHINKIMKEMTGHTNALYDIREDCCKIILYFDCIISNEDRDRLLAKLAEVTGTSPESYKIVAYYN